MAFQVSPGVQVVETDLTLTVPGISTSGGATVGTFEWGPVEEARQIESEQKLVSIFGTPNANTYTSFFTAANFLAYSNNLQVVRVVGTAAKNAIGNANANAVLIKNEDLYNSLYADGSANTVGGFAAKFPGELGNSLKVAVVDSNGWSAWQYKDQFDGAPATSDDASNRGGANDEVHVAIVDEDGLWTGVAGTILEKFQFLSKGSDARKNDGSSNYYKKVLNDSSQYVWWMGHPAGMTNWGTTVVGKTFTNLSGNLSISLSGGVSDDVATDNVIITGLDLLKNTDRFDVGLLPLGAVSSVVANHAIDNVAEVRRDLVVFVSPELDDVLNNVNQEATDVVAFRDTLSSTSFAFMDCNWKYQYDRYNDVYRWVPLNGDIAGLAARTDFTNDAWWSPAGYNRGIIKNAVKLAWSPSKADRDTLYKNGVNPVVTEPGFGTGVLLGDKTLLARPSAFDRINVRRLFIVLEKAIARAAKFQLFDFNDTFTRAQFKNLVEPFLRDVQGRRGLTDFRVVCDTTNNTPEVIDRNEFVGDIYLKPTRSINFITLNFVATRTGISFDEVGA